MKQFVSILSNAVRHNNSIGLLILAMVVIVAGGSAYLSSQPVHAAAYSGHAAVTYTASNSAPARSFSTPVVTATPVTTTGNSSSIEGRISQVFGSYASSAISVARCKSGLAAGVYNASGQASVSSRSAPAPGPLLRPLALLLSTPEPILTRPMPSLRVMGIAGANGHAADALPLARPRSYKRAGAFSQGEGAPAFSLTKLGGLLACN